MIAFDEYGNVNQQALAEYLRELAKAVLKRKPQRADISDEAQTKYRMGVSSKAEFTQPVQKVQVWIEWRPEEPSQ